MDMIKKPINQNEERYITKSDRYQISATSSIKPLDLPFGVMPENLLPVLEVDGIIVNVGEYKLVSQATLDSIKESNNPHYDIKDNGEVKGKKIGQTIPSITLNMDKLLSVIKERDIQNRVAGVTDVEYVTEGTIVEGTDIPLNLVQQINYTLNSDVDRPMDTYTLAELQLSDESNYNLTGIEIVTRQSNEQVFDNTKLEIFLADIKKRMQALGKDFDTIKDIHYSGLIPNDVNTFSITKMATAEDVQEAGDFQIVYKSSKLVSVEKTPAQILEEQQQAAANQLSTQLQQAVTAQPPVIELKMRKKRDLKSNLIGVYTNDPTIGKRGKLRKLIKEGDTFWGYFLKDWERGQKIWAVYEPDKTTFIGWGIADKNDFVDPV